MLQQRVCMPQLKIPHNQINTKKRQEKSILDSSSVQFSRSVASDSLRTHESQHARPPCPSQTPRVYSNTCPSSRWCHPATSSSVFPFSSCPQSLPAVVGPNSCISVISWRWVEPVHREGSSSVTLPVVLGRWGTFSGSIYNGLDCFSYTLLSWIISQVPVGIWVCTHIKPSSSSHPGSNLRLCVHQKGSK